MWKAVILNIMNMKILSPCFSASDYEIEFDWNLSLNTDGIITFTTLFLTLFLNYPLTHLVLVLKTYAISASMDSD